MLIWRGTTVNAIEHVIITRTENTIKCKSLQSPISFIRHERANSALFSFSFSKDINSELDELDREEFYRLKKVAAKKVRDTAETDAQMKAKREAAEAADDGSAKQPADILASAEDDDIIF